LKWDCSTRLAKRGGELCTLLSRGKRRRRAHFFYFLREEIKKKRKEGASPPHQLSLLEGRKKEKGRGTRISRNSKRRMQQIHSRQERKREKKKSISSAQGKKEKRNANTPFSCEGTCTRPHPKRGRKKAHPYSS